MDKERLESMIAELSQIQPKYAYNSKDFIPGKTPVYYSGPFFDNKEIEYALKAFLTGSWLVTGEYVARFQRFFAKKFNVEHAHMVNSGSSANLVMVAALKKYFNWNADTEILVSPVGFPTTIAPIVQNGMKPVFVDIEFNTLNFDLSKLLDKITPNTKAVFVSPVLGNPPDMEVLKKICDDHNLVMIGDNCDSLGTKWENKWLTDFYFAWSCSFYPAHHISTGEGGMVCSNNEEVINHARSFSWWGRDCRCVGSANLLSCGTCGNRFDNWLPNYDGIVDHKYVFVNMGYNLKPLDLQGAIGLAQLEKFEDIEVRRRNSKYRITELLKKHVPEVRVAHSLFEADPSWFGVPIITDTRETKEKLQKHFEENKIQTRNYFAGNILLHPGYSHLDDYRNYPNANKALSNVFFVGAAPHYNDAIFNYFDEVLSKWTGQTG